MLRLSDKEILGVLEAVLWGLGELLAWCEELPRKRRSLFCVFRVFGHCLFFSCVLMVLERPVDFRIVFLKELQSFANFIQVSFFADVPRVDCPCWSLIMLGFFERVSNTAKCPEIVLGVLIQGRF